MFYSPGKRLEQYPEVSGVMSYQLAVDTTKDLAEPAESQAPRTQPASV